MLECIKLSRDLLSKEQETIIEKKILKLYKQYEENMVVKKDASFHPPKKRKKEKECPSLKFYTVC